MPPSHTCLNGRESSTAEIFAEWDRVLGLDEYTANTSQPLDILDVWRSLNIHDANHSSESSENPSFLQIREKELKVLLFLLFSGFSFHVLIKGMFSSY